MTSVDTVQPDVELARDNITRIQEDDEDIMMLLCAKKAEKYKSPWEEIASQSSGAKDLWQQWDQLPVGFCEDHRIKLPKGGTVTGSHRPSVEYGFSRDRDVVETQSQRVAADAVTGSQRWCLSSSVLDRRQYSSDRQYDSELVRGRQ